MKKLLICSAVILIAATTIQAQSDVIAKNDLRTIKKEERAKRITLEKQEGHDISFQSKQQFIDDFGDIKDAAWTSDGYFDEAIFTKDGKQMKAFYDIDNKLVGTVVDKTFNDLPAVAQKYISKKYKDYNIQNVIFYDDNEANETDMILYGAQFDDEDNYFVEVSKGTQKIVLHVSPDGDVSYFKQLSR
jgi:hypothetical protein